MSLRITCEPSHSAASGSICRIDGPQHAADIPHSRCGALARHNLWPHRTPGRGLGRACPSFGLLCGSAAAAAAASAGALLAGILFRRMQSDPTLKGVGAIVVDEVCAGVLGVSSGSMVRFGENFFQKEIILLSFANFANIISLPSFPSAGGFPTKFQNIVENFFFLLSAVAVWVQGGPERRITGHMCSAEVCLCSRTRPRITAHGPAFVGAYGRVGFVIRTSVWMCVTQGNGMPRVGDATSRGCRSVRLPWRMTSVSRGAQSASRCVVCRCMSATCSRTLPSCSSDA